MTPAAQYRALATHVAAIFEQDEAATRDQIAALCEVWPGARVLDVGAGPGSMSAAFARIGVQPIALDRAWGLLAETDGHRVVGDADDLPIGDRTVDAVCAVGLLHAVRNVRAVLAECRRVVRPGGRIVVVNKGLAPWLAGTSWYAEAVAVYGAAARQAPPLACLPPDAVDVSLQWIFADTCFALAWRRGI